MKGSRTSDAVRAAVIASLLEGQAVTKVADDYKIDKSTVSRIKKAIPPELLQQVATKKDLDIAGKIVDHLNASFEALSNILAITRNNAWLSKQSASDLATFSGVTADKVFRVLQAIEDAQNSNDET